MTIRHPLLAHTIVAVWPYLHAPRVLGRKTGESGLAPLLDTGRHGLWIDFVLREEATERVRTKQTQDRLAQLFVVRFCRR